MITKWVVSTWADHPEKKEYRKETDNFYMHATGRGRDEKLSRSYRYFDTEEQADKFILERNERREKSRREDRIRQHGVELLEALEACQEIVIMSGHENAGEVADKLLAAIAKAKGEQA